MISQISRLESKEVVSELDKGILKLIWDNFDRYKQKFNIEQQSEMITVKIYSTSKIAVIDFNGKLRVGFNSIRRYDSTLYILNVDGTEYMCNSNEL